MCYESREAGIELKTVSELRKTKFENEHYWSDEHINKVFGHPAPDGYKS